MTLTYNVYNLYELFIGEQCMVIIYIRLCNVMMINFMLPKTENTDTFPIIVLYFIKTPYPIRLLLTILLAIVIYSCYHNY